MVKGAVAQFEAALADYQQAAAARAFWMGRVALYTLLRALGVGENDRVGICSYTCLGAVEAVTRLRAVPVFLDVDRHMNIAPAALEQVDEPLKVLVLQHTFGVPCDLDASLAWAKDRGVPVIEDSCHTLGATWRGQLVGTFGVASIYSFQWGKPLIIGQGGMATFQDAGLAREVDRLIEAEAVRPGFRTAASLRVQRPLFRWLVTPRTRRILRAAYGWACARGIITGSEPTSEDLRSLPEGFLKLCSPGQAAIGLKELRRWPETMRRRQEAAATARAKLTQAGIELEEVNAHAVPVHLRVPVWVRAKQEILAAAERQHLDIAGWYCTPAHPLEGEPLHALGYAPGSCPMAEAAFDSVVTLPTRPPLSPRRLATTVRIIQDARDGGHDSGRSRG